MGEDLHQPTFWSLRANVTRQEANLVFGGHNPGAIYWRVRRGPLRRMALAYVPFRLYRVHYEVANARQERLFALESVEGALDLLEFPAAPREDQLLPVATRNCLAPGLDEDRAESLMREKVLRIIFQNGFFRLREPKVQVVRGAKEFGMPYWLGFYGGDGSLCFRVLDAVRRRMEGGKATALFERWLVA